MITRREILIAAGMTPAMAAASRTSLAIEGDSFLINGKPTYAGRQWNGMKIEGLLMNTRMVQGIYDDENPETRTRWAYPDTKKWDAERNTREFIAAMPEWKRHGILAFSINLQGGSPEGYSKAQPWSNTAVAADGTLKPAYMKRLKRILGAADRLGMVAICGIFYFGQDQRVKDEAAVKRAVENTTGWLLDTGHRNILLEVNNECDVQAYDHEILKPARVHELVELAKAITKDGRRLLTGTSYRGGAAATDNVAKVADFLLLHGNGANDPDRVTKMIRATRALPSFRTMPVLVNEDDHFDFDKPDNHMIRTLKEHVSWGYFDPGKNDYSDGYQCPPVNWGINTERKKAFFGLCKQVTGA